MGKYVVDSVNFLDFPAMMGFTLVVALAYVLINLAVTCCMRSWTADTLLIRRETPMSRNAEGSELLEEFRKQYAWQIRELQFTLKLLRRNPSAVEVLRSSSSWC